jgi:hypothetical protein
MDEFRALQLQDRFATNRRGEIAIAHASLRALEKGMIVSRPVIECRYDLVLDDGLKLYRTQVKYGGGASPKQCQGVVSVSLRKWRNDGRRILRCYTTAEIDLVLVYVRKLNQVLRFGPEVFNGRDRLHIRIEPTRNNQAKGCLLAED